MGSRLPEVTRPVQAAAGAPFSQLGVDSLAAVEIAALLEGLVGRRLSVTLLFEHPDLAALEGFLGEW